ncbi:MAG: HD domain-containing protein, partial [Bdellovibrionota bacterium]|nr:HD domain-containing protein [Bdellovibrionota bacterium]
LLEHILSCAQLSITLSPHYGVNKNYVVLGAILHDICKIYELSQGPLVEYSDEGKLVGHLVKSVEIVDHFSSKIQGFPQSLKLHIKHILLSHHGEYEYGSPKLPQTSEAYLVHLIDLMDSKMGAMSSIKKSDLNPGKWSGYVKHLDRVVYKEELPFFKEYLPQSESSLMKEESMEKPKEKKTGPKNLTPTPKLGSLLKDFKIE